jgi:hypothetical protein
MTIETGEGTRPLPVGPSPKEDTPTVHCTGGAGETVKPRLALEDTAFHRVSP